jgi:tetrapyrrole methylase family protein/MazG family protein
VTAGITVIGLGPGDPLLLTRAAWALLSQTREIYLRTGRHPVVQHFPPDLVCHTFDDLYDESEDFESVYGAIIARLRVLAESPDGVVYGVPGDPTVGEATVLGLREAAAEHGLPLRIVPGISFVEPCLDLMGVDALDGLFIADALELAAAHHPPFHPDAPALVGQLYSSMVAADVKLTLMNQYPDDHPVNLIHAAGTDQALVEAVPLHAIDRSKKIESLTALYVPPLAMPSAFESFQETVAHLRAPDGCPWDRKQTLHTLRPHLLEEAYEALQAIDGDDMQALREELGDLLLQIVLQAQIALEDGEFSMADVMAGIQHKIVHRHPHVFGELHIDDVGEVLHNWELLKASEREEEGNDKGLLDGIPMGLPALAQAAEIQDRVVRVGFDWPSIDGVLEKIHEELREMLQAETTEDKASELGDLLFAVVNYARWLEVNPETSLREANFRFRRRFKSLESKAKAQGRELDQMTLDEMDALWEASQEEDD